MGVLFLLQELKKRKADKLISEEVAKGKLYIGESAGAIVTAPEIAYVSKMDTPEKAPDLTEFNGLNLVDIYVLPHFNNASFKKIIQQIKTDYDPQVKLYPISNNETLLVTGKNNNVSCRIKL